MTLSKWQYAQQIERRFWDTYTGGNSADQRWLLGVLGISFGWDARSVIDLGGGPRSILLQIPKDAIRRSAIVIDPLQLSFSEQADYRAANVTYFRAKAEDTLNRERHPELAGVTAEEVWLYNVLQHVDDVRQTLRTAMILAERRVRIVEWLHEPIEPHHLHSLTPTNLMLYKPWCIEQEVMGTLITQDFEKQFLATIWKRR